MTGPEEDALSDRADDMCREFCDHCGWRGDDCTCWMLDPVTTGEATI